PRVARHVFLPGPQRPGGVAEPEAAVADEEEGLPRVGRAAHLRGPAVVGEGAAEAGRLVAEQEEGGARGGGPLVSLDHPPDLRERRLAALRTRGAAEEGAGGVELRLRAQLPVIEALRGPLVGRPR